MKSTLRFCFQILMAAQGCLWVALGILRGAYGAMDWVALLMLLDAAFFFLFAFLYKKACRLTALAAMFLAGNLLLSLTDQTGPLDYIVFGADAASLALLFIVIKKHRAAKGG